MNHQPPQGSTVAEPLFFTALAVLAAWFWPEARIHFVCIALLIPLLWLGLPGVMMVAAGAVRICLILAVLVIFLLVTLSTVSERKEKERQKAIEDAGFNQPWVLP